MKKSFFNSIQNLLLVIMLLPFVSHTHAQNECVDYVYFDLYTFEDATSLQVDIVVRDFTDIASFQFSLNYDRSIYDQIAVTSNGDLQDLVNFNPDLPEGTAFAWVDFSGGSLTLEDNSLLLSVLFTKLKDESSPIFISDDPVPTEVSRFNSETGDFDIICLTTEENNPFASLSGHVRLDDSGSCTYNDNAMGMPYWKVRVYNDSYEKIVNTNQEGRYIAYLDVGQYNIEVLPPNLAWGSCDATKQVTITSVEDEIVENFAAQSLKECTDLDVSISTPFLRRCFENRYFISYCNEGTVTANDVSIQVDLDPYFIPESSDVPYTVDGNTLTFELGTLNPFECGRFYIKGTLSCDAELGQTHCSEASIFPSGNCDLDNYTGAIIQVNGECNGDEVQFKVTNSGDNSTIQAVEIIVVEDDVMRGVYNEVIEIGEEKTYAFPANGSTYRIIAQQVEGYPIEANATQAIEACGTNDAGGVSSGFVTTFPDDSSNPNTSIDCQENIGSYDPNDKQGFPKGYGDPHYIYPEDELEYLIRFQNTGTDTAFLVRIIDTLSTQLDIASFTVGTASHPFSYNLDGNVLTFEFNPIALVDSTRNEEASNGFVSFKIKPKKDIVLGTLVENNADIYFDFNEPVRTNTTFHTVDRDFLKNSTAVTSIQYKPLGVFPNPVDIDGVIHLDIDISDAYVVEFYEITGHKIKSQQLRAGEKTCNVDFLQSGIYTVKLVAENETIYLSKLAISKTK